MENKPICDVDENGTKYWYLNGKYHREDGPAIIFASGNLFWYKNGIQHRIDGPAIEWTNGHTSWIINGHLVTELIGEWAKDHEIDLDNLTEVDKLLIKLTWSDYGKV